jgi:DsbC/DsbD-like thiol-disulfide interchange protein
MPGFFLSIILSFVMLAASANASGELSSSTGAQTRLFQAETLNGVWNAGLAIDLEDGWKTYWRIPGESGVPPQFDWSGSKNLKAVTIGWPAPRRYSDAAGETIGYKDEVVFPLRIEPQQRALPVELELRLFYAMCKNICIPAEAKLALTHSAVPAPSAPEADRRLLERFAAQLPGAPSVSLIPKVTALRLQSIAAKPVLEVSLARPVPQGDIDIFVEGHPIAHFRKPQPAASGKPTSVYRLAIDGLKDVSELRGAKLTLTLVSGPASLVQDLPVE